MADNRTNNANFAQAAAEDEEAAWILLSFKDNSTKTSAVFISTSNNSHIMSSDKETTQQAGEVHTIEHAMAQGAQVPTPALPSHTPSRLTISSGGGDVRKPKASPKAFISHLTSDVATTSGEVQREIRERAILSSDRSILPERINSNLEQKGKKVVANHTKRAIDASGGDQNDTMDIDSNTSVNNAISSGTCTKKVLPNRSVNSTSQQRGNAPTMAADQGPLNLRIGGFAGGSGRTPGHKPSINPFTGAQTTTAQHFLQTTANPGSAGDDARRAHLNNAIELAKSLAVVRPLDYAAIDWKGPAPARASNQPYNMGAAGASTPKCSTFRAVYIHTAKCDECNTRNRSVLYRCSTCSTQLDRACMTNNHEHGAHVDSLDWTDHGAQSASKPRGTAGSRVKKTSAKNDTAKKKVSARDEASFQLGEQLASNDEKNGKKRKKKREANSLSKSTDGTFEDDGLMMLSPRVRIKREDKKGRSLPPEGKRTRRETGAEKRKAEEANIYQMSDNNALKALKKSRRSLNDDVWSRQSAPTWPKSAQSGSPAVPTQNPAHTAGSGGISSFFANADRFKKEYTRVTEEMESMRGRLAELQDEKYEIEGKIMKRMDN